MYRHDFTRRPSAISKPRLQSPNSPDSPGATQSRDADSAASSPDFGQSPPTSKPQGLNLSRLRASSGGQAPRIDSPSSKAASMAKPSPFALSESGENELSRETLYRSPFADELPPKQPGTEMPEPSSPVSATLPAQDSKSPGSLSAREMAPSLLTTHSLNRASHRSKTLKQRTPGGSHKSAKFSLRASDTAAPSLKPVSSSGVRAHRTRPESNVGVASVEAFNDSGIDEAGALMRACYDLRPTGILEKSKVETACRLLRFPEGSTEERKVDPAKFRRVFERLHIQQLAASKTGLAPDALSQSHLDALTEKMAPNLDAIARLAQRAKDDEEAVYEQVATLRSVLEVKVRVEIRRTFQADQLRLEVEQMAADLRAMVVKEIKLDARPLITLLRANDGLSTRLKEVIQPLMEVEFLPVIDRLSNEAAAWLDKHPNADASSDKGEQFIVSALEVLVAQTLKRGFPDELRALWSPGMQAIKSALADHLKTNPQDAKLCVDYARNLQRAMIAGVYLKVLVPLLASYATDAKISPQAKKLLTEVQKFWQRVINLTDDEAKIKSASEKVRESLRTQVTKTRKGFDQWIAQMESPAPSTQ